jgi:hypothetical protein
MALFSQSQLGLGAPDCPVVHRTVSGGAPDTGSGKLAALGKKLTAYGYNSPNCPVCTGQCPVSQRSPGQRSAA